MDFSYDDRVFGSVPFNVDAVSDAAEGLSDFFEIPEEVILHRCGVPDVALMDSGSPVTSHPLLAELVTVASMLYDLLDDECAEWLHESVERVEGFLSRNVQFLLTELYTINVADLGEHTADFDAPESEQDAVILQFPQQQTASGEPPL